MLSRRNFGRLVVVCAGFATSLATPPVYAACNLIPVAGRTYPSVLGAVESPITAPDRLVRIRTTDCDPSAGFGPTALDNSVVLTFEPPAAGARAVSIDAGTVALSECVLPGGRCRALEFVTPDTSLLEPPFGLAGPARVTVLDALGDPLAEIGELFLPTSGCDRFPERVFEQLTVLPRPNLFTAAVGGPPPEVLATTDGSGSLLVPFDYWGDGTSSVLAETPGAPVAILLRGGAELPAMGMSDPQSVAEVIAAQSRPSDFVRSYTLDGRPLPPLLRIRNDGGLLGTADAVESVLRIARTDGYGGPPLFDFSDRFTGGVGPIVIGQYQAEVADPLPLVSLTSSSLSVAFARDELREGVDLNHDGDNNDFVAEILDPVEGTVMPTDVAVTRALRGAFLAPLLRANGAVVALAQSEVGENLPGPEGTDLDGDGDFYDNVLRIFAVDGTPLGVAPALPIATAPVVDRRSLSVTESRIFARSPGEFVEAFFAWPDDPNGIVGLHNLSDVVVSPDGRHIYAISAVDDAVTVFARDPSSGTLSFVDTVLDGVGADALDSAFAADISPDGGHLYVASQFSNGFGDNALSVFERDPLDGTLSQVEVLRDGVGGVDGINRPLDVAVTADGRHVYVVGGDDNAVAAFSRDSSTGLLTFVEAQFEGVGGVAGLIRPVGVAVSPDGTGVYVASEPLDVDLPDVAAFARDPVSGTLTFVQALEDSVSVAVNATSHNAQRLTVSPDSRNVYVSSFSIGGVAVYGRDPATSALTPVQTLVSGNAEGQIPYLDNTGPIVVAPDGMHAYVVAGGADDALHAFRRNPSNGALDPAGVVAAGVAGAVGIDNPFGLAISPDARHLYIGSQGGNSLVVARPSADLIAFDSQSGAVSPAGIDASMVRAAGDLAVVTTSELAMGVDLNNDGDPNDHVAQIVDASGTTPVVRSLGLAAWRVALSESTVAVAVSEFADHGLDRNDDGDPFDNVLAVGPTSGGSPANTHIAADLIEVIGDVVVLATPESAEGPSGRDLNGDDDTADLVIRLYDRRSHRVTETGQSIVDFVVGEQLVAFRTSEADQGGQHLNDDLDTSDTVMQVFDLASGTLVNTRLAADLCTLPGCEPAVPYKIKGKTVSFLTDEIDQNDDLNGDGDQDDIVLTVYDVVSRRPQFLDTVVDTQLGNTIVPILDLPVFPEEFLDGTLLLVEATEGEIGVDINGDGVVGDDAVSLFAGDDDEDGAFDDFDSCVSEANAGQVDADGDGLGDAGCDPEPDACPTSPLPGCYAPDLPGAGQLLIKLDEDASRTKLAWKWGRGAALTAADFGNPATGLSHYSLCIYDAMAAGSESSAAAILPGGVCGKRPCWTAHAGRGFKYKDKLGFPDGVQKGLLRSGDVGKAKIKLSAKGVLLDPPQLPLLLPAIVQLVLTEDTTTCWETTLAESSRNDGKSFKARSE